MPENPEFTYWGPDGSTRSPRAFPSSSSANRAAVLFASTWVVGGISRSHERSGLTRRPVFQSEALLAGQGCFRSHLARRAPESGVSTGRCHASTCPSISISAAGGDPYSGSLSPLGNFFGMNLFFVGSMSSFTLTSKSRCIAHVQIQRPA
jgi:hypothetical protein